MFILSGFSVWMTFMGLYSIISCFCPAYMVYTVIFSELSEGLMYALRFMMAFISGDALISRFTL